MPLPVEPPVGTEVVLVTLFDGGVVWARYTRHEDGSASLYANGLYGKLRGWGDEASVWSAGADGSSTAWKMVWDELRDDGFIEVQVARSQGVIPGNWELPKPPRPTI